MRDNALASSLRRMGHAVTLIPLYTPLRSEQADASDTEIFYGGVNVYLQHATRLFRHTPRVLDWIFDRPWLLNVAGKLGAQTAPEKLAGLTLSIIEGEEGAASKELDRLVEFMREHVKPQVISLPNLMFVGMARVFRQELGAPVVCEMTGEDIFLDAMAEPDRSHIQKVIRSRVGDVSRFVATTDYYAGRMAEYLDIPRGEIDVVYTGISNDYFTPIARRNGPPTIGYLARICPEKGLDRLIDALKILREMPGMGDARVLAAGFLGAKDHKWFNALQKRISASGLERSFEYLGEVDRAAKQRMLDSIDVFSVPTAYPEAKGIYILEALARGVPVVQPGHGSFPELVEHTGGGIIVPPGDPQALASALADLLRDSPRRRHLGDNGRAAVESTFTEERMAANMLKVFEDVASRKSAAAVSV
ncbi:MAG TPA: glycosyltransferase family 4 protein [Tepidisphaeraceae bacterium]|jgi:glycosyltransferase involved in cell wall biosynthesis|nr:glycosyltransferase family 4 protein [Tepidisphaeraceae bacterium]